MKKLGKLILACCVVAVISCSAVLAGEYGTIDEAKTLLGKAVDHIKKVGEEQALKDISTPPQFVDRDLYVYCVGPDNKLTAHPINKGLIGIDFYTVKDSDGKAFGKEMVENIKKGVYTPVEYKWYNKTTGKLQMKEAYYQKIGKQLCVVGVYKY